MDKSLPFPTVLALSVYARTGDATKAMEAFNEYGGMDR